MDRKINKTEEIQNQINVLTLELNQETDSAERNKLIAKIAIKQQEKKLERMKDLM